MSEKIESYHYGGRLLTRNEKHKYFLDGEPLDGVTSACDEVNDGKSGAMSYWGADTVTRGVMSRFPESNTISLDEYKKLAEEARRDLGWAKTDAANIGTIAHQWIEEYVRSKLLMLPPPHFPTRRESAMAVEAFLRWEEDHRVHFITCEALVLSLKNMYAGQMDLIAEVDGPVTQVDFKTSNSFRDTYRLQTAAYSNAYEEEHGQPIRKRIVLMLGKETGDFTPVTLPESDYDSDVDGFIHALGVHRWVKRKNILYPRKKSKTRQSPQSPGTSSAKT